MACVKLKRLALHWVRSTQALRGSMIQDERT